MSSHPIYQINIGEERKLGIKKSTQKSICLLLTTAMVANGFPGLGLLEGYAAQYTIQAGEIPTKVSSIEQLPSIVNCVAEGASIQTPKEITWEINNNGSFNNAGSTVNVTGTIKENGQQEKASILAVPDQVIYRKRYIKKCIDLSGFFTSRKIK